MLPDEAKNKWVIKNSIIYFMLLLWTQPNLLPPLISSAVKAVYQPMAMCSGLTTNLSLTIHALCQWCKKRAKVNLYGTMVDWRTGYTVLHSHLLISDLTLWVRVVTSHLLQIEVSPFGHCPQVIKSPCVSNLGSRLLDCFECSHGLTVVI